MGSFSWMRADKTTKRSNLTYGDSYKILIPKEFGGGFIKDKYYDYGVVFAFDDKLPEADLYGILAYWNSDMEIFNGSVVPKEYVGKKVKDLLLYDGDKFPETMEEILKYGNTRLDSNRCIGIDIGCYDEEVDNLKYPLKLVSASYKGTYEECDMVSYTDPEQGFRKTYWRK